MKHCVRTLTWTVLLGLVITAGCSVEARADIQTLEAQLTAERFTPRDIYNQKVNNPSAPNGAVSGSLVVTWDDGSVSDFGSEVLLIWPIDSVDLTVDDRTYLTQDVAVQITYLNGELQEFSLVHVQDAHGTAVCPGTDDVRFPFSLVPGGTLDSGSEPCTYASVNYPAEGSSPGDFYGTFQTDTVSGTWQLGTVSTGTASWSTVKAQF